MAGFGTLGFGSGPLGLGTPITAEAPPDGPAGCKFINPATGDFEQDADTHQLKQMPAARQAVLLALRTLQGSSSAIPGFGVRMPRKMGDTFEAEAKSAITTALAHLTGSGRIRLDGVKVEKGLGGRARFTISFTDTSTGVKDSVGL